MQTKPLQHKTFVHCPQELINKQTGEIKIDLSEAIAFAKKEETIKKLRDFVNSGIGSNILDRFRLCKASDETLDTLFSLEEDFHDDILLEMYKLFQGLSQLHDVNYALALVLELISLYLLNKKNDIYFCQWTAIFYC